jgi:hypothetical protein
MGVEIGNEQRACSSCGGDAVIQKSKQGKIPAVATVHDNHRAQAGEPGGAGLPPYFDDEEWTIETVRLMQSSHDGFFIGYQPTADAHNAAILILKEKLARIADQPK